MTFPSLVKMLTCAGTNVPALFDAWMLKIPQSFSIERRRVISSPVPIPDHPLSLFSVP